jgi:DNA repair protein RAD16
MKATERVMRSTGIRRKRSTESEDGNLSVSTKPATKRRAFAKSVYVEIPFRSANVSAGIALEIVIAYLKTSKDKGKGRASSNFGDGLEDDVVPDSEGGLEYGEPQARQSESDGDDPDFEDIEIDSEDEEYEDVTLRHRRKLPHKGASRTAVRHSIDLEEAAANMTRAAMKSSTRDMVNGGASASAGSTGRNIPRRAAAAAAVSESRFVMEQEFEVDSVVPDSDFEDEVVVYSDLEDEPTAQRVRTNPVNGRSRNKGQGRSHDADGTHHDYFSARREARKLARLEKQEMRMLEYRLGRRLTYVGLASNFYIVFYPFGTDSLLTQSERSTIQLHRHHPELRDAWGDLEAAIGVVEPQKAEQPLGLRVTLLPFQQESLYWMRKQEFGQYSGGLLAVSSVCTFQKWSLHLPDFW